MKKILAVSFHPRLAAALEFVLGIIFIGLLPLVTDWTWLMLWLAARLMGAFILIRACYYAPSGSRVGHGVSAAVFFIGMTSLLLFVEWPPAELLLKTVFVLGPAIQFMLLPRRAQELSFVFKPERRFRLFLTTMGMAGLWSGVSAIGIFHLYDGPVVVTVVPAALFTGLISAQWWREYTEPGRLSLCRLILVAAVYTLVYGEMAFAVLLWPLGYFLSGLILAWIWYVLWLMLRFYVSAEGINWKKQAVFCAGNGLALLFLILFIARWN